jgi:hypothetical protein
MAEITRLQLVFHPLFTRFFPFCVAQTASAPIVLRTIFTVFSINLSATVYPIARFFKVLSGEFSR